MVGNIKNLVPNSARTPEQRKAQAKKAGIASGKARKERSILKKLGYTNVESFDTLTQLQQAAINSGNVNAAIKAEELKGKLAGLYVDKVAQTNSDGEDIPISIEIVPVKVKSS